MSEQLALLFRGSTPISRHTSFLGAKSAEERIGRQALRILALYREFGPLTDWEVAIKLGIERSSVNARRAQLTKLHLVRSHGTRENTDTGLQNVTWGLVDSR